MKCNHVLILLTLLGSSVSQDHYVRLLQRSDSKACQVITEHTVKAFKGYKNTSANAIFIKSRSALRAHAPDEKASVDSNQILEIFGKSKQVIDEHIRLLCKTIRPLMSLSRDSSQAEPEVVKLVDGGDPSNRIDVVFMGDGYTANERAQFFEDMKRLTEEMFEGDTFKSYLPVFNIWAVYVESVFSGIGYDGKPENTPFGLYREQGQLRVIWPGNPEYARQVCLLTGPGACDFPSIIANDDFYGGLGGEFVISTKSARTGTIVLRHEMGHNFVNAGDEYDNSWAYFGVNNAGSPSTVGWRNWLTGDGEVKEERAIYRLLEYPWKDLSTGGVEYEFESDGQYSRWYLQVSVSAAGEADSLEFKLDGQVLPWTSSGYDDREFYDWYGDAGFSPGKHSFSVNSKTNSTHPAIPRMIASIRLHELGTEDEFHADNHYVGAYPTWSDAGTKSYRPTNEGCLMRNMTHSSFCSICQEGMWLEFLKRISLIDGVLVENGMVTVQTLALGQLRPPAEAVAGERLEVTWSLEGVDQVELSDLLTIPAAPGSWRVKVRFVTPEVRADPEGVLTDYEDFTVGTLKEQ